MEELARYAALARVIVDFADHLEYRENTLDYYKTKCEELERQVTGLEDQLADLRRGAGVEVTD